jgi:hypothetical protein
MEAAFTTAVAFILASLLCFVDEVVLEACGLWKTDCFDSGDEETWSIGELESGVSGRATA